MRQPPPPEDSDDDGDNGVCGQCGNKKRYCCFLFPPSIAVKVIFLIICYSAFNLITSIEVGLNIIHNGDHDETIQGAIDKNEITQDEMTEWGTIFALVNCAVYLLTVIIAVIFFCRFFHKKDSAKTRRHLVWGMNLMIIYYFSIALFWPIAFGLFIGGIGILNSLIPFLIYVLHGCAYIYWRFTINAFY